MPRNNQTKPVPYVPIEPDSDPSSSESSSLESSDSFNSGYYKQGRHTRNKSLWKRLNNDSIKKCTKLTSKLIKGA